MTRGPEIITAISFSVAPPTEYAREMEPHALYDALKLWGSAKARYDGLRTPEAREFRAFARRQIGRIKYEMGRRGLPSERWQYESEQALADARDEAATIEDVRYGGCP